MAKNKQKPRPKAPKKSGIGIVKLLLIWIVTVPLFMLGYPSLTLLALGMLPVWVSWILERIPGNPRTICIGAFNVCGMVPYMLELWEHHQSFAYVWRIFQDPNSWLTMYGAAFLGYTIYWGIPKIVLGAMRISARGRVKALIATQSALLKEWGDQIRPDKRAEVQNIMKEEEAETQSAMKPRLQDHALDEEMDQGIEPAEEQESA